MADFRKRYAIRPKMLRNFSQWPSWGFCRDMYMCIFATDVIADMTVFFGVLIHYSKSFRFVNQSKVPAANS